MKTTWLTKRSLIVCVYKPHIQTVILLFFASWVVRVSFSRSSWLPELFPVVPDTIVYSNGHEVALKPDLAQHTHREQIPGPCALGGCRRLLLSPLRPYHTFKAESQHTYCTETLAALPVRSACSSHLNDGTSASLDSRCSAARSLFYLECIHMARSKTFIQNFNGNINTIWIMIMTTTID